MDTPVIGGRSSTEESMVLNRWTEWKIQVFLHALLFHSELFAPPEEDNNTEQSDSDAPLFVFYSIM